MGEPGIVMPLVDLADDTPVQTTHGYLKGLYAEIRRLRAVAEAAERYRLAIRRSTYRQVAVKEGALFDTALRAWKEGR